MKLKRDETSSNAPAADQISVGELAINTKTGILYSKMSDGTVIKWLGVPVCETAGQVVCPVPVPEISFSDVVNFCCGGDSLVVYVSNLLVGRTYTCSVVNLSQESTAVIAPLSQVLLPDNKSDRAVIFNLSIESKNSQQNQNPVFKISVYENVNVNNQTLTLLRSEKTLPICCNNCGK